MGAQSSATCLCVLCRLWGGAQLHAYVFNVGYGWELGAQLHAVREGEQEGLRRLGGSGNNSYKQLSCTVSTLKSDIYETENFEPQ